MNIIACSRLSSLFRVLFALLLLSGSLSIDGVKQLRQRLEEVAREFDALLARDATLPAGDRVAAALSRTRMAVAGAT